ncbi:hypothetical protein B0O99DRAFT_696444 [Bisporella sp. PMI_857]|nr:hypothetical protein B0O99DRAFT_696444 [Bisporella sp. PMI_857]
MKFIFATFLLSLLSIAILATPIADPIPAPVPIPDADPAPILLDERASVTCAVTTANAPRQSCARASTNTCPVTGRFALGASVTVRCYTWGDIVGSTSLWFYLSTSDFIAAAYVQNCYGMGPC